MVTALKAQLIAEALASACACTAAPRATACKSSDKRSLRLYNLTFLPVMCFPNGYTDVHGKKHLGPHCLKRDGDGETVPAAAHGIHGEPGHKAFEKTGGVDLKGAAQLTKKLRLLFGRDGWKDHAAGDVPFG